MTEEEKEILYKALKVYALIISYEKSQEECQKFVNMADKLGDIIGYDLNV